MTLKGLKGQLRKRIARSLNSQYKRGRRSEQSFALYTLRPDLFLRPDKGRNLACNLRRKYGMSVHDYAVMKTSQADVCKACGRPALLHVDHDHATGKVRGLLCFNCNAALGHVQDSISRLESLAAYLRGAACG